MAKSDTTSSRRDATTQKKWLILLILISISVAANLRLLSCTSNNIMNQSGVMRDYDATLPVNTTSTTTKFSDVSHHSSNPSVACFFMVDQKTIEKAMTVRYSHWGKRCTQFVIFSNGISSSEKVEEEQQQPQQDQDQTQHHQQHKKATTRTTHTHIHAHAHHQQHQHHQHREHYQHKQHNKHHKHLDQNQKRQHHQHKDQQQKKRKTRSMDSFRTGQTRNKGFKDRGFPYSGSVTW